MEKIGGADGEDAAMPYEDIEAFEIALTFIWFVFFLSDLKYLHIIIV